MTLKQAALEAKRVFYTDIRHLGKAMIDSDFLLGVIFEGLSSLFFFTLVYMARLSLSLVVESYEYSISKYISSIFPHESHSYLIYYCNYYLSALGLFALAFSIGMARFIVIVSTRSVCGCQLNPLVTISYVITQQFPLLKGIGCIFMQLLASFLAALYVPLLFQFDYNRQGTKYNITNKNEILRNYIIVKAYPDASSINIFVMETVLSILFIFVNIMISYDPDFIPKYKQVHTIEFLAAIKDHHSLLVPESNYDRIRLSMTEAHPQPPPVMIPLPKRCGNGPRSLFYILEKFEKEFYIAILATKASAFGILVTLISLSGSSISGGAANPARVFGPSLLYITRIEQWPYWAGGILGTVIACIVYETFYVKAMSLRAKNSAARFRYEYFSHGLTRQ